MSTYEEVEIRLQELLSLQQQIRLFAETSLSEDNPFRPMIEKQSRESAEGIRDMMRLKKDSTLTV